VRVTGHEPRDGRIDWVQICLLGPLEVRADSGTPVEIGAARAAVGDPEFAEAYAGGRDTRLGTVRELLRITLGA
jgi:hypothetical protein